MAQLDNRVALVTGGAHGFGRVLALTLARAGADIAIADMGRSRQSSQFAVVPDLDQVNDVVKEVEALGRHAIGLLTDVRKGDDCQHMAQKTIDAFGTVDILCANAGTFLDDMRPAWELPEADWDVIFDVNLKGAWLTTKYVVPHMLSRRAGKIIFTASRNSLKAEPNYAHYVAAKHGLLGYMKALAIELGPFEINVNAVCPTQMVDKSRRALPRALTGIGSSAILTPATRSLISNPVKKICLTGAASSISPTWLRRCCGWRPTPRAP
jgi:NAD(P)-dependent dehydrogenase (short-subunit alcohol dehydrogenase family)